MPKKREAEAEPVGVCNHVQVMTSHEDVMLKDKGDRSIDRRLNGSRPLPGRNLGKRFKSFGDSQHAGMASPAFLQPERPFARGLIVAVVEPLVADDPIEGFLRPRVLGVAESDQAPRHVSC